MGMDNGRPPWWATSVIVVGVVVLAVGLPFALHRGAVSPASARPLAALPTVTSAPTTAAPTPTGQLVLSDDFERADSATVGVAPTGQPWNESGAGGCAIASGRVVAQTSGGGNCYLSALLPGTPSALTVKGSWTGTGKTNGGVTLIASTDAGWTLQDMVHFELDPSGWVLQLRTAGGTFDAVANGGLQLKTDGTVYSWGMLLSGDTATLLLPDGANQTVTDPRIGKLNGPYVTVEPGSAPGVVDSRVESLQGFVG